VRKSRALSPAVALAAVALLLASSASATVMVEVPIEDMVRDADAIAVGTVERVGVRLEMIDGVGAEPHTIVTLRVREWLKGGGEDVVTIDEIGGVTPQVSMAIAGTPEYHRGQEVVVFLRSVGRDRYRTFAMAQGHFEIQRGVPGVDDVVVRDTSELGLATWSSRSPTDRGDRETGPMIIHEGGRSAMRLADFLAYVDSALAQLRLPAGADDTRRTR
jgi:hypothetical protein